MALKQKIVLRPATFSDLDLLQHWDQQAHVVASDPDSDWEWESELQRNPDWREQLIAELEGRAIGFVQIIDPHKEDSHYWGDFLASLEGSQLGEYLLLENSCRAIDIWIGEDDCLEQGFGSEMMRHAINRCFACEMVSSILIDPLASNIRAQKFYQRLGFEFEKPWQFETDHCKIFRLQRAAWCK